MPRPSTGAWAVISFSTPTVAAPTVVRTRTSLPNSLAFITASVALLAVFFSSGLPISLYARYRVEDGISDAALALTTVAYLGATASSLLLMGRLSDALGRRRVAIGAVLCSVCGSMMLMIVHTSAVLMCGRVLQGLACGVASSALGAYVLETAPRRAQWLGAVIASTVPGAAVPVGALVSGLLVEYGPAPRLFGYTVLVVVLITCALVLPWCPEPPSSHPRPSALQAMRPRLALPAAVRLPMVIAALAYLATWSFGGFLQSFTPALVDEWLGSQSSLVVGAVFSSLSVLTPLGGTLLARQSESTNLRIGVIGFALCVIGTLLFLRAGALWPALVTNLLASLFQGAAISGGMRGVLKNTTPRARAEVLATAYLLAYSGSVTPVVFTALLGDHVGLGLICGFYLAVVVGAATSVVVIAGRAREQSAIPARL